VDEVNACAGGRAGDGEAGAELREGVVEAVFLLAPGEVFQPEGVSNSSTSYGCSHSPVVDERLDMRFRLPRLRRLGLRDIVRETSEFELALRELEILARHVDAVRADLVVLVVVVFGSGAWGGRRRRSLSHPEFRSRVSHIVAVSFRVFASECSPGALE
jgi:hypothetical protein